MKSLIKKTSKKKERQGESPFTGFDKIYDMAMDHAIKIVRELCLSKDKSSDMVVFVHKIEKELMELKSTNQ